MISISTSDEKKLRHEKANDFCLCVMEKLINSRMYLMDFNNKVPGIIYYYVGYVDKKAIDTMKHILEAHHVSQYFDVLSFRKSIQVNLKKEYIDQTDELEVMLKLMGEL